MPENSQSPRPSGPLIAITGIGCRLPGGVDSPTALWDAMVRGESLLSPVRGERWEQMSSQLHPEQRPEQPWTIGVIDDIEAFDHQAFSIPAHEAAQLDPQQRMVLEVVVEALNDAGLPPSSLAGSRTGVWTGSACFDQGLMTMQPGRLQRMTTMAGAAMAMLANRVSYHLNLRGPSMNVDTACSASGTALHLARQSLLLGEVDTAIVIGVNLMQFSGITAGFVDGGVIATDGMCRPFDEDGKGYVRAEATAALVLRRLDAAQESRDRVYALVRGSAANCDGYSPAGLYAPNPSVHLELLKQAYDSAGMDPAHVDYVQCHGTGTKAGDSSEGRALARVLAPGREGPLVIGSVKSLIGHTEGASGVVGVIAAALSLYHATIPPTACHETIRSTLKRLPLRVPTAPEPWPQTGRARTAGVSAFGLGGSNVHIVLEQAPEPVAEDADDTAARPRLIPVSALSEPRLRDLAAAWAPVLADSTDLGRAASTAQHRRDHHPVRAAVVAESPQQAAAALTALGEGRSHPALVGPAGAPSQPGRLVWMFAGQGSQHADMARACHAELPVFREALEEARAALAAHLGRQPWRPGEPIPDFETAQHAIWLTQVAQAATWRHWGYVPDAVIGHSLGEVAAAHAAGALSLDDAARVVAARSALLAELEPVGGLLVTDLTAERAEEVIAAHGRVGTLVAAAYNAPDTTVLSGPEEPLEELRAALDAQGVFTRRVPNDVPAHSPSVAPLTARLAAALDGIAPRGSDVVFHSTAEAAVVDGAALDAAYWARQLRSPVRFTDALAQAVDDGATVLELGGRSTLGRGATATLAERGTDAAVVSAGDADRGDHAALLDQLAALHTRGHSPARWPEPVRSPVRLPVRWDHGQLSDTAAAAPTLAEALTVSEPDPATVLEALVHLVADTLGITPEEVDVDRSPIDLGLSSVAMIGLRDLFHEAHPALSTFGVRLLFDPTVTLTQLSEAILDHCHGVPVG